jgi:hypothetical protein
MNAELARLMSSRRKCRCCGAHFAQLLMLEYDRPDMCPPDLPVMDNSAWLAEKSGDLLTEDFCRLGDRFFLRALLAFALEGDTEEFLLEVWVLVHSRDFDLYLDRLDDGDIVIDAPIECLTANAIPPQDGPPVKALLHLQPDGQRPEIEITDPDNPLMHLQQDGLFLDQVLSMLEAYGHDKASLLHDA